MIRFTNEQTKSIVDIVEALIKGGEHLDEQIRLTLITDSINNVIEKHEEKIKNKRKEDEMAASLKLKAQSNYNSMYGNAKKSGVTIVNNLSEELNANYSIDVSCTNGSFKSRTLLKKNEQAFIVFGNAITVELTQDIKNG